MAAQPNRIVVDNTKQELTIEWKDGHKSAYGLDGLRAACPCAECAGGHENMGGLPDPEVFTRPPRQKWTKIRLEAVGSYALRITWDDGHDAGIYSWERLRSICPCCRTV